jgi:hypothetical protein
MLEFYGRQLIVQEPAVGQMAEADFDRHLGQPKRCVQLYPGCCQDGKTGSGAI